jgi:archaellum component FlaC
MDSNYEAEVKRLQAKYDSLLASIDKKQAELEDLEEQAKQVQTELFDLHSVTLTVTRGPLKEAKVTLNEEIQKGTQHTFPMKPGRAKKGADPRDYENETARMEAKLQDLHDQLDAAKEGAWRAQKRYDDLVSELVRTTPDTNETYAEAQVARDNIGVILADRIAEVKRIGTEATELEFLLRGRKEKAAPDALETLGLAKKGADPRDYEIGRLQAELAVLDAAIDEYIDDLNALDDEDEDSEGDFEEIEHRLEKAEQGYADVVRELRALGVEIKEG